MQDTEFYLVRHGETEWNKEVRIQGHKDIPLTEHGLAQAQALARTITRYSFDAVYSSDLIRARSTAEPLAAALRQPLQLLPCLREKNLGVFQGYTQDEALQRFPQEFKHYLSLDPDYQIPEGESPRQFAERCLACLEALAEKHPGQRLLVVSHGGLLSSVFKQAVGVPLATPRLFKVLNTSLNRFRLHKDRWILESWGDVSHLENTAALDDV